MKKKILVVVLIVAVLAIAGGAFYGGIVYAKPGAGQRMMGQGFRSGSQNAGGRFMTGANFLSGNVIAKDDQSITIKDRSGSSRIIFYSNVTEVSKFIAGSLTDVAVGKTVMVNGKTNSDGSMTAQSIQLMPQAPSADGVNNNQ